MVMVRMSRIYLDDDVPLYREAYVGEAISYKGDRGQLMLLMLQ